MNIHNAFLVWSLLLLWGCKVDIGTNEAGQFGSLPLGDKIDFATLNKAILTPSCVRCHSWAQNESSLALRIVVGDPENSILYQKVKSGEMPPSGALSTRQLEIVERYIRGAVITTPPTPIKPTYASLKVNLFERSCTMCHNDERNAGDLSFLSYENVKENADDILESIESGDMPKKDRQGKPKAPVPSEAVVNALKEWMLQGALEN